MTRNFTVSCVFFHVNTITSAGKRANSQHTRTDIIHSDAFYGMLFFASFYWMNSRWINVSLFLSRLFLTWENLDFFFLLLQINDIMRWFVSRHLVPLRFSVFSLCLFSNSTLPFSWCGFDFLSTTNPHILQSYKRLLWMASKEQLAHYSMNNSQIRNEIWFFVQKLTIDVSRQWQ